MPKIRDVLRKVRDLCRTRGFIFERQNGRNSPEEQRCMALDYGPLGTEIKRNFLNEWWHEIVTSRDNVHGLELSQACAHNNKLEEEMGNTKCDQFASTYLLDTHWYARELIQNGGEESPVGFALTLNVPRGTGENVGEFMFRACRKEFCKLCFFCKPSKVSYWMDYWMRKRLSWWKKYADMPAEFSLSDEDCREHFIQHGNDALTDTMAVMFHFPWGKEAIECISSYSDVMKGTKDDKSEKECLGVVIATVSVERGILAYLLDAFHENEYISAQGVLTRHTKLRLHPALAPTKVAVLSNSAFSTDLGRVARQLAMELRQAGITSHYLEVEEGCDDPDTYNWQQDEIGTPYTVTVQDSTLTNGIVTLRNRDTTLSEYLHISEILKTVQRHLDGS